MMQKPVLVVMAAGMGSRFGGLKQIEPVDRAGRLLMDFSIYDALKAGFEDVLFIIRKEIEQDFMRVIGRRMQKKANAGFVCQELDALPAGCALPDGRQKPWGTTHAIFCCREALRGRGFLTVNADDFYGAQAFALAYRFLTAGNGDDSHAIIGYALDGTLTENGTVSRGVCVTDDSGRLLRIDERKMIRKTPGGAQFSLDQGESWNDLPANTLASMNLWAFGPGFLRDLEQTFPERMRQGLALSPLAFEETLSDAVQDMLERGVGDVCVLPTNERWIGMTYRSDYDSVRSAIAEKTARGAYPEQF